MDGVLLLLRVAPVGGGGGGGCRDAGGRHPLRYARAHAGGHARRRVLARARRGLKRRYLA